MNSFTLHPLFQEFLEKFNKIDRTTLSASGDDMREALANALPPTDGKTDGLFKLVQEEEHVTKNGVSMLITRPCSVPADQILPVILFIHGGGWVTGNPEDYKRARTEFTLRANAAVVFVDYSLSPKVRYPVAVEECYDALSWIVDTDASIHRIDSSKIAVVGDSAGGNLAAALAIHDKQRHNGKSRIQSQVLFYPVTDPSRNTESYKQFSDGYMLTAKDMKFAWDAYVPDEQVRSTHSTASPLVATLEELKDLPPALVYTAEVDVLRDEGEAYAGKLMQAGVPVLATRVVGAMHGFLTLDPSLSIADEIYDQTASYLQRKWNTKKA